MRKTSKDLRLLHDLYFRLPEDFNVASITIPPAPSVDRRPYQRPSGGFGDDKDPGHPGGNPSTKDWEDWGYWRQDKRRPVDGSNAGTFSAFLLDTRSVFHELIMHEEIWSYASGSEPVLRIDLELLPEPEEGLYK